MNWKAELRALAFGNASVQKSKLNVTDEFRLPPDSSHASTLQPRPDGKFESRKPCAEEKKPAAAAQDGKIGAFYVSGTQVPRASPPPKTVEVIENPWGILAELMKNDPVDPKAAKRSHELQEESDFMDDDNCPSARKSMRTSENDKVPVVQESIPEIPADAGQSLVKEDADFVEIDSPSTRKSKRTSKNGKFPAVQGPIPELPADYDQFLESCDFQKGRKQADMTFGELKLKGHDLYTLRLREYLNDLIIDKYLELICKRNMKSPTYRKCFAFNTYFYQMLTTKAKNLDDLVRWQALDLSVHDLVFLPINEENHWFLFVADFSNKNFFIYDSLYTGDYAEHVERIMEFLQYFASQKGYQTNWQEWSNAQLEEQIGPNQSNGTDCGIFLCQYCEHLSRRAKLNYAQNGMSNFRKIMQYELLKGELLPKKD